MGDLFFKEYWAPETHGERRSRARIRVNDPGISLHEQWGRRWESQVNGHASLTVAEDLFTLTGAELYLELWGGHPGTAGKRFSFNGRQWYPIPDTGTESGYCTYFYPSIPIRLGDLVSGENHLQFATERGSSFWGHFIVDNAAVRAGLKDDHPQLAELGAAGARPTVKADCGRGEEAMGLSIEADHRFRHAIESVEYVARYAGYDEAGTGEARTWHGYTLNRCLRSHVGGSLRWPFAAEWDLSMIPDQDVPVEIRALVRFVNGVRYWTVPMQSSSLVRQRKTVLLYTSHDLPQPFWSRANNVKECTIEIPGDPAKADAAELHVRTWDGGEGNVADPFTVNGHPYAITSRIAVHDVVYAVVPVDPAHLVKGRNRIRLVSDTEHHGIEVLLPGPAIAVRTCR